jgi:hypothetical protein
MQFVNWRPIYVEHPLSKNDTFHRASRLHPNNRVSSRLRQMLPILKKCRLVYTKCLLWGQSRPERGRTGPGHSNLASRLHPFFLPPSSLFLSFPGWLAGWLALSADLTHADIQFCDHRKTIFIYIKSDHSRFGRCLYIYIYLFCPFFLGRWSRITCPSSLQMRNAI